MGARWATFTVGLALILAPLALGYAALGPVLHEVALGLFVCVATLAALEWPATRFCLAAPGIWLLLAPRLLGWQQPVVQMTELCAGALLVLLAPVPSVRLSALRGAGRVQARMPA